MKIKNCILTFSIITLVGVLKAEENKKRNLNDYTGMYSFVDQNSSIDNVKVEFQSDSTLTVVAAMGSVTLKHVKDDEFKVSEYDGQVLFIRDEAKLKVISVKVNVPSFNIETVGTKEQLETTPE